MTSYCSQLCTWHCVNYLVFAALTWRDLTKVHRRVRIPSPLLSSLTNLNTRNKRKNVMDTFPLSPLPYEQINKHVLTERRSNCEVSV